MGRTIVGVVKGAAELPVRTTGKFSSEDNPLPNGKYICVSTDGLLTCRAISQNEQLVHNARFFAETVENDVDYDNPPPPPPPKKPLPKACMVPATERFGNPKKRKAFRAANCKELIRKSRGE